jgi:hypothetical protein
MLPRAMQVASINTLQKAFEEKYGIKVYVENSIAEEGSNEAIIHLSGKDISVL